MAEKVPFSKGPTGDVVEKPEVVDSATEPEKAKPKRARKAKVEK